MLEIRITGGTGGRLPARAGKQAEEELDAALGRIEPGRATLLPVILNRQLVGLLTAENVGEFYMIRRALAGGSGSRPPFPPVIRIPRVMPPPLPIRQPSS